MEQCVLCARAAIAGSLSFGEETREADGPWQADATATAFALCDQDYSRITGLADVSVKGFNEDAIVLGIPQIESTMVMGSGHCDCCQAQLGETATTMELFPSGITFVGGKRTRRAGTIRRLRLCIACHGWWLSLLRDPSFMNGTAWRNGEGNPGGWRSIPHGDAVFAHLGRRDELILAMTMEADGRRARRIAPATKVHDDEFGFVRAGRADRATRFILSLPREVRGRFAVVAQADQLGDAEGALKRGAREILASPLSPQQIVGAGVRSLGSTIPGRDPKTGLCRLGPPLKEYGPSHAQIRVTPRGEATALEVVLLVRKFVRGWDEIEADGAGNVVLRLYAEKADVESTLGRLRFALGTVANFDRPGLTLIRSAS